MSAGLLHIISKSSWFGTEQMLSKLMLFGDAAHYVVAKGVAVGVCNKKLATSKLVSAMYKAG